MSELEYDFIDHSDFFKKRQKSKAKIYTKLDALCLERDIFYKKLLFKAWCITDGNVSMMAKGLKLSRGALYKYLKDIYGNDYINILNNYMAKNDE